MATITTIETQKRRPDRANIHLDGEFAFSLAGILAAKLKVGQQLDPSAVASLKDDDAAEQAFQRALRFLSFRTRSEAELRVHLRKHKVPDAVVDRTMLRLKGSQLADDSRFAQAWIENRNTFRPRGRRALLWELKRKGISAQQAESAVAELDEPALAYQAAGKRAQHLATQPWPDFRRKLSAFLARRGFDSSIIAPVVSRLWGETHTGPNSSVNEDIP
jgi:regulatory protein